MVCYSRFLHFLGLVQLAAAAASSNLSALIRQLSPGTQVFYPNTPSWWETIPRWNTHGAPTFFASIKPGTVHDVQNIVRHASRHHIPFLAMGGGHGYTTSYGALDYGLEIDLSTFNHVSVDAQRNRMTIGGGVRFQDIFDPLYAAGKEIQTGTCACVGIVGATLGGGVSKYQGVHGMIIDALESLKVVTASGELVTASRTSNPELFWGMRGAGFNFGIVTEATYRIYGARNGGTVLNADFRFPARLNATFFEILRSFDQTLPAAMSFFISVNNHPTFGPGIVFNAVYPGPREEGLAIIRPFLDLVYEQRNITEVPWNVLTNTSIFGMDPTICIPGNRTNTWSIGVARTDVATHIAYFNALVEFYQRHPEAARSGYLIQRFSTNAVLAVPDDETAYPHRDIAAHILLNFAYVSDSFTPTADAFARDWIDRFQATSGSDRLKIYVSFAHGTEGPEAWYSPRKLPRLMALKKTWDPMGLFRFNNPLPIPAPLRANCSV